LQGPKKLKRPNLTKSSFKKGQILKNEKRPNKGQISFKNFVKITKKNLEFHKLFEICSDLSKQSLEINYFCQHSKKDKKWPNGQIMSFLTNSFKKAKWQP